MVYCTHLEGHIVDGEDVLVRGEAVRVLVFPQELLGRHGGGADCLECDLLARRPVLREVDAREPALADLLHHVVLRVEVHLKEVNCSSQRQDHSLLKNWGRKIQQDSM